jgi:hypothetical protein
MVACRRRIAAQEAIAAHNFTFVGAVPDIACIFEVSADRPDEGPIPRHDIVQGVEGDRGPS